jgi:lipopolysaccharide/colanic/teichoic acid biosynthesis glycosyltransferase
MMPNSKIASASNKLYPCRNGDLRHAVPQPHHDPSTLMQRILPEDLFLGMLCLERKRTERSRKKFLLLLLDAEDAAETRRQAEVLKGVINAANAARRETDPAGWYKHNSILGIIFTELGTFGNTATIDTLLENIHEALLAQLSGKDIKLVRVSVHVFSDDSNDKDSNNFADPAFYPDLIHEQRAKKVPLLLKRVMDIIGSVAALVLFSPLLAVIALMVKLTSKGPVLFKQERLGQFGKTFTCLKFRSMYANNDLKIHQVFMQRLISGKYEGNAEDGSKPVYKMKDDPRITRVGRFLRRTSLDELPQFINVLRSDMSLVGPRPPLAYEYEEYDIWHRRRVLEIKPGITGLWQVKGRSRVRFDDMVRLDLQYARGWSLWLDVQILLKTPGAVVLGDGAY